MHDNKVRCVAITKDQPPIINMDVRIGQYILASTREASIENINCCWRKAMRPRDMDYCYV
jgi:hypothetical protein